MSTNKPLVIKIPLANHYWCVSNTLAGSQMAQKIRCQSPNMKVVWRRFMDMQPTHGANTKGGWLSQNLNLRWRPSSRNRLHPQRAHHPWLGTQLPTPVEVDRWTNLPPKKKQMVWKKTKWPWSKTASKTNHRHGFSPRSLGAVWPVYSATRSARDTSTKTSSSYRKAIFVARFHRWLTSPRSSQAQAMAVVPPCPLVSPPFWWRPSLPRAVQPNEPPPSCPCLADLFAFWVPL